jgi:hypothetical protein
MWSADQHGQVMALLHKIDYRIGLLMTAQADVDAATALNLQIASQILAIVTELQADLAGQGVNTAKLDASLPPLQSAVAALQQLADSSKPTTTTTGTGTTAAPGTTTTGTTSTPGTTSTGTGTTTAV